MPFAPGHDPRFVYANRERKDLLAQVRQAIADGEPFVMVTGDSGTGKTLAVSDALGDEDVPVCAVFLAHPTLRRDELLEAICIAFGVEADPESKPQTLASLGQHFTTLLDDGRRPVLVMDEAHALSEDLLEELRLLSNLESEGQPLLQIVLVGLPELERRLARQELAPLRQRIAVQCQIRPLSAAETERYIHHRVAAAGGEGPKLFPSDTCFEIHRFTYGFPRDINRIAGRALARARRASAATVLADHVRAAVADSRLRLDEPQAAAAAPISTTLALHGLAAPSAPLAPPAVAPAPAPKPAPAPPDPPVVMRSAAPAPRTHDEQSPDREAFPTASEAGADIDAWVSRFKSPDGPPVIGARAGSASPFAEAEIDVDRDALGAREGAVGVPDAGRDGGPRAPRGQWDAPRLTLAAVAVLVVAIAGLLLPRALRLGAHDTPAMRAGSIPVADSLSAVTRTAEEPPKAKRSPAKPKADSTATRRRYAIRVATYLDRERAEEERDRIARTTGLHTRIWDASDGGAVHHIVVGAFDDADEAERSADGLLQRGLVQEARVVGYRSSARRRDR